MPELPAYPILFTEWIASAAFWYWVAYALGKRSEAQGDGCMLGLANILLSLVGGGIGYALVPYPWSLVSSLAGASFLPALATFYYNARTRR